MSSLDTTRNSAAYTQSLAATTAIYSDNTEAVGFIDPTTVGTKGITAIIKQNNTLLHGLVTIQRRLDQLAEQILDLRVEVEKLQLRIPISAEGSKQYDSSQFKAY